MRSESTLAEVLLWQHLMKKQMLGHDFHRQKPIGGYIVDFFCHELMLAIEIDGSSHNQRANQDKLRQAVLEKQGIRVLRFLDPDVRHNLEGVLAVIKEWVQDHIP